MEGDIFIRLLYVALNVAAFTTLISDGHLILTLPSRYVSLSGDLEVPYLVTRSNDWSWSDVDSGTISAKATLTDIVTNETVTSVDFRLDRSDRAKVIFRCGLIVHAGRCILNVIISKNNRTLEALTSTSQFIEVEWPSFTLIAPPQLETYTTDVTVTLESTGIACHPREKSSSETWLELEYTGPSGHLMSTVDTGHQYVQSINDFYTVTSRRDILIRCSYFDQAGFYRLLLRRRQPRVTTIKFKDVIVSSETIRVTWSEEYKLSPQSTQSILPCTSGTFNYKVFYQHPECILTGDRIRVYGRRNVRRSAASPVVFQYVFEARVELGSLSVLSSGTALFPCSLFNGSYAEYCFKYVSVARRGAVNQVRSICVPTYGQSQMPIDGGWSEWSPWSGCSATCGHGTQIRHRFCDSPTPFNNGNFCNGRVTDSQQCHSDHCPERTSPRTPVDDYKMSDSCKCGCQLNVSSMHPAFIVSSARQCSKTSTWILTGASSAAALHFTFLYFDLNDTTECLQVRDGDQTSSELLLHETGRKIPTPVTSSSKSALLRYHPTENSQNGSGLGFVTRIELTSPKFSTILLNVDTASVDDHRLINSPIHLSATLFCVVLLLVSLGLAVHHFIHLRKQRLAEEALLSSPYGSSSPISLDDNHLHIEESFKHLNQQPLTSSTSVSDLSIQGRCIRPRKLRRKKRKSNRLYQRQTCTSSLEMQSPINSVGSVAATSTSRSNPSDSKSKSPEDYLRDSKLFHSNSTTPMTSPGSPPLFYPIHKLPLNGNSVTSKTMPLKLSPLTPGMTRKLPVATVSPQPARIVSTKTYCADKLKQLQQSQESKAADKSSVADDVDVGIDLTLNGSNRIENPNQTPVPVPRQEVNQRLLAAVSEVSLADAEFEYDYYDYGVHETPGSYFTHFNSAEVTSWLPPYVPRPPSNEQRQQYPLNDFRRRSGLVTNTDDEDDTGGQNSMIIQESSADSDTMTASATSDRIPESRSLGLNIGTVFNCPSRSTKPEVNQREVVD